MLYITYNGVRSDEMGMWVERTDASPMPLRKVLRYPRPGGDGELIVDGGGWQDVSIGVRINRMNARSASDGAVNRWLTGPGWLAFSDDAGHAYRVKTVSEARRSRSRTAAGSNFDGVEAVFLCEPYRYLTPAQTLYFTGSQGIIENPYAPTEPRITLQGSGEITFGMAGGLFLFQHVPEGGVRVDCAAGTVTRVSDGAWFGDHTLLDGDWPCLSTGQTALSWTGNVQGVTVEPRFREL